MYRKRASLLSGLAAGGLTGVVGQAGGLVWAVAAGVGVLVFTISFIWDENGGKS